MSLEQLPSLPGAKEEGATNYVVVNPPGGLDADARALLRDALGHLDVILLGPGNERINVRYEPGDDAETFVVQDPTRTDVIHLFGGWCYQTDLHGTQIGRKYGCDGSFSTASPSVDVPAGTLNVFPIEEDVHGNVVE